MGIIIKQSIQGTIYSYIGGILGFVTSALVFPHIFSPDKIGLLALIVSYSMILSQFASLGINNVTSRLFPYFRDQKTIHHGFLFIIIVVSVIGFVLTCIGFLAIKSYVVELNIKKSALFVEYFNLLLPVTFFTLFFTVLDIYNTVLFNAVKGLLYKEVVQRIIILVIILFFYLKVFEFNLFVYLYAFALAVPAFLIMYNIHNNGHFSLKPDLSYLSREMKRSMTSIAFYGFLVGVGSIVILNINNIMVNSMINLSATGIFTITYFIGNIIIVPTRAISKISMAVITDAWKNNDQNLIKDIYYKSCINQMIIGIFLFATIWANIDNVFRFLPDAYAEGRYVIFFVALANLISMSTGVNTNVIYTSKYYKVLSYFMVIQIVITVFSNYFFIKTYGLVGAAIAFAVSFFVMNLMYYLFLLFKFKMQPFNYKFLIVFVVAGVSYFIGYIIPTLSNFILDIVIRSLSITLVFGVLIYYFNLSDVITERMKKITSLINRN